MSYKQEFIEFMVRSGVLTFGDFITKSGRRTPYFINTGNYRTGYQAAKLGEFYARCIHESGAEPDLLYGPAYKGIPLAVACASSLYTLYGKDVQYCFNRKEAKDHGEGGLLVGGKPSDGQRVMIVEDVITAGTSVRESVPLLKACADVALEGLVVSVDRMERGSGELSALEEVRRDYGIKTYSIVNVRDIISALHNKPIDGRIYITDDIRSAMEQYLEQYGSKGES
ncbi:MAG: orotate phosphoribosyltransferase [Firmicutes bacterium]|nr:orotate phosphoribosyltransferase [Bacillota bacterium]